MPVLSEPYAPAAMMGAPYLLLAFALFGLCSFVLKRRFSRSAALSSPVIPAQTPAYLEEKRELEFGNQQDAQQEKDLPSPPYQQPSPRIQRPPQPPPFTPPMPLIATQDLSFGLGTNASYYSPISESPIISTLDSFDSFEAGGVDIPRRRSYTKTTTGGVEVTGEVVMGEGWRRHTRVFGGGVCMACEESERRMAA